MTDATTPNLGERELDQAAREGRLILFHMRFNAGYPLTTPFAQAVSQDNHEKLAQIDARDPFIVEFHSLEEFKNAERIVRDANPEALEKSWVWYENQVRPHDRFRIDTREKMRALYEELREDRPSNTGEASYFARTGFPRILSWKASRSTLEKEHPDWIRGNGDLIGHNHGVQQQFLHQVIGVEMDKDGPWRRFAENLREAEILSFPYVLPPSLRVNQNELNLNQPGPYMLDVIWDLKDPAQLGDNVARDGGQPRLL